MRVIWDSKRNWTIVFLLLVISALIFARQASGPTQDPVAFDEPVQTDLDDILARDTLHALTGNSSLSYFIYKGQPMGYEYELLKHFADRHGLYLDILVARDFDEYFSLLNSGRVDVVANNLTVTNERQRYVDFTDHHMVTRQVLIQRKPEDWHRYTRDQIEDRLLRNPIDLIGKQVHVRRNSSFDRRLHNLSDEIGGEIHVQYHSGTRSTDELIQMVADGRIDYTVADNHVALINAAYYKNLDVYTALSFPQRIAWAVRKTSPALRASMNEWLDEIKRTGEYQVIYRKYFKNTRAHRVRRDSDFFSATGGAISAYDELIREHAAELNWDWRLLAAQIYKESRFDPSARSWAGARGLLQIMPETAERFGDSTRMEEPAHNLLVGMRYLRYLQEAWQEIPDSSQRIKFILASYNVGQGHVLDARRLAEKFGRDPQVWDGNVDSFLVKKSRPDYYRDEVVYYGYCRGSEPFNYVRDVLRIYDHYRDLVDTPPAS